MIYTLVIQASPNNIELCQSALAFARQLLAMGHNIHRLFLYGEGVHLANHNRMSANSNGDPVRDWCDFLTEHRIDAIACVSAASRRGLYDQGEAHRHQIKNVSIAAPYALSGLGQLIEACALSDRTVTFR